MTLTSNKEKVKCKVCGREFIRFKHTRRYARRESGIKTPRSVTCSRKCSRELQRHNYKFYDIRK